MSKLDYFEFEKNGFQNIILEDCFITAIQIENKFLIVDVLIYLSEDHEEYEQCVSEELCWRRGKIVFIDFSLIKTDFVNIESFCDKEIGFYLGEISFLYKEDDTYYFGFTGGEIIVMSKSIKFELIPKEASIKKIK